MMTGGHKMTTSGDKMATGVHKMATGGHKMTTADHKTTTSDHIWPLVFTRWQQHPVTDGNLVVTNIQQLITAGSIWSHMTTDGNSWQLVVICITSNLEEGGI